MPPPAALTKQERTTASQTAVDQHFAAEMLVALKDMLDQSGTRLLVPSARVAFELLWVQVLNSGAPDEQTLNLAEYWMPANTYYSSLWMVQCDNVRDEDPPTHPLPTHTYLRYPSHPILSCYTYQRACYLRSSSSPLHKFITIPTT